MAPRVVIRCRKCWIDVGVQLLDEKLNPCPKCGQNETYPHSFAKKSKKTKKKIDE